jgi:nucleoprotein TPR
MQAELWKKERELKGQHKEIADLQIQVAVLLKECADVQQRFGVGDQNGEAMVEFVTSVVETTAVDTVISDRLVIAKILPCHLSLARFEMTVEIVLNSIVVLMMKE